MLGSNKSDSSNESSSNSSDFNIDPNTIFKIQKMMSNFTKNDPKRNLLKSLKPFLRKSRQDKLGEYITILSVIDAIDIFGSKGSE